MPGLRPQTHGSMCDDTPFRKKTNVICDKMNIWHELNHEINNIICYNKSTGLTLF